MENNLEAARQRLVQGLSHVASFWGFPKAMGAIYAVLYLSPTPLSLDDLVENVGVTKGAISTNVRALERLGMVHEHYAIGQRKDFYYAETDFWGVVKGILKEREKSEFDHALSSVQESLELVAPAEDRSDQAQLAAFYRSRLEALQRFFNALDNFVAAVLALDDLRSTTIERLLGSRHMKER